MDKLQRDEFYNYRFLSNLTVSPEKTAAAVTVWQAEPKNNSIHKQHLGSQGSGICAADGDG